MRLRFLLLLTLSATVSAQEPDTTDWHSYFPLEAGNEWHYEAEFPSPPGAFRYSYRVVSDSLVNDTTYYVIRHCFQNEDEPVKCNDSAYLNRYDEELATIVYRLDPPNEPVSYPPWFLIPCRLDSPFGELGEDDCFFDLGGAFCYGEYDTEWLIGESKAVGTLKGFDSLFGARSFLSGIGFVWEVGDGGGAATSVVYARVGGVEYGTPVVSNEADVPLHQSVIRTFPNPARHEVTLQFSVPTAQQVEAIVYNLRSVLVETRPLGVVPGGVEVNHTIDVSKWPSGLYYMRLIGDQGFSATKGIVVIH